MKRCRLLLCVSWVLVAAMAKGHDLQATRVSVVLHEQHSVALSLYLDFAGLLQHQMAPNANINEFLVALAAQPATVVETPLATLRKQVETELVLRSRGSTLTLSHWQWPSAKVIHAALRERLMASVVAADDEAEDSRLLVKAESADPLRIERLSIELPELIKPAVVVSYRPQQTLVAPKDGARLLEF